MAGTVATIGVVATLATITVSLAVVGGAIVEARRVAGVADAAALAAADAASGAVSGTPCDLAGQVAAAGGLRVNTCAVEGLIATITVGGAYGGIPLDARSRAGPPDATAP